MVKDLPDHLVCPLCGKPNHCAAGTPVICWCQEISIPEELLKLVPRKSRGKACVCRHCVEAYNEDRETFIQRRRG